MHDADNAHTFARRALLGGLAATATLGVVAEPARAGGGNRTERNRRRVADAFRRAAERGTLNQSNDFYLDILHPDVQWTVASVPASTYPDRADFLARGAAPVLRRLATPIRPQVRSLIADGDTVVAVFDGTATALDGVPYVNTYTWIFEMRGRQAIRVLAFLDLVVLNELIDRVPLPA